MKTLILGSSTLLDALKKPLTEKQYGLPVQTTPEQIQFLANHPTGTHKGVVITNQNGNWQPAMQAGWEIYWAKNEIPPVGANQFPEAWAETTIGQLVHELYGVQHEDRRLAGDLLVNASQQTSQLLAVTSNTGGVGKSLTCRRLAERAAKNMRTLLVDANMLQGSQRSFFDPLHQRDLRTIADWRPQANPTKGAVQGSTLSVPYDVAFTPPIGVQVSWEHYRSFIAQARKIWQLIIVDMDRVSADDLTGAGNAVSELMLPALLNGDKSLTIVKAGKQTQGDALQLLAAYRREKLPQQAIGIKQTIPIGVKHYKKIDYSQYGVWFGEEQQTVAAAQHIADGVSGWSDASLDTVRDKVLQWVAPEQEFYVEHKKHGWFGRG